MKTHWVKGGGRVKLHATCKNTVNGQGGARSVLDDAVAFNERLQAFCESL